MGWSAGVSAGWGSEGSIKCGGLANGGLGSSFGGPMGGLESSFGGLITFTSNFGGSKLFSSIFGGSILFS